MAGQMGYGQAEPPPPGRPPSYIGYSALVTLFCCFPFGLVAMVWGLLVLMRSGSGDAEGAKRASDMAEKWMYAGCGAAFLLFIGWLIYRIVTRLTTGH
jgi:hypothetical protein